MMKRIIVVLILISTGFYGCKGEVASKGKAAAVNTPAKTPASTAAQSEAPKVEKEVYVYDPKGRRDPFMSLVSVAQAKDEKKFSSNPVENYDVDEIKLIAIAWDSRHYYAVVTLPDHKSYTIRKGMTLGLNNGKVTDITKDSVFIREQIKNYKGQVKPKDTILRLRKEEEE